MSKNRNYSRNGSNNNNKHRSHGRKPVRQANPQQTLQKAKQAKEKYLNLAREALSSGDRVEAESYFQHADHYTRVMNAVTSERQQTERPAATPQENQPETQVQAEPSAHAIANPVPADDNSTNNVDAAVIEQQKEATQPQELTPVDA